MVYSTKAYAKVNIGLKITGKRDDGYHLISSYFLLIPFYDEIEMEIVDGDSVEIRGNESYLESSEDLMARAYRLFREKTGLEFGLKIRIKKNIPSKAGLGGGSSDAAAVLRYLNSCYKIMDEKELLSFSASIGADCPFFVSGYDFAYVEGIGEKVEKREFIKEYRYITLFRAPGSGVSTKDAYSKLDSLNLSNTKLGGITYPVTRSSFSNDFERIEGDEIYNKYRSGIADGDYFSLSGSGSVWFLLSRDECRIRGKEIISTRKLFID